MAGVSSAGWRPPIRYGLADQCLRTAERDDGVFPDIFAKIGDNFARRLHGSHVMTLIYKICPRTLWREAERDGAFRGAPVDHADGYIHFSTAAQVRETAA